METNTTTANLVGIPEPKFPHMARHKAHWVRQSRSLVGNAYVAEAMGHEYTIETLATNCETTVAKAEAVFLWDDWNDANPIVLNPSFDDLPRHRVLGPLIVHEDDAMLDAFSYEAERVAKREGRTVWAGFQNGYDGWVAPVD